VPQLLPVTIKHIRTPTENEKAAGVFNVLGNILLFLGFLMILFSMKSVWDLKIENWRLCKENAALMRTVRDNIAVEKFREHIPSEEEIMEFEKPSRLGAPDLSWSVSVQIFWSSPFITPCDMNWLARELADQIYHKKEENDQEREKDIMEIQEKQAEDFLQREERIDEFQEMEEIMEIQNEAFPIESDEVFKVESGGPFLKTSENLLFVSPNADDEEVNEEMVRNDTEEDRQNLLSQWLESSDGNKDIFLEEDEVSLVNMIEKEEPTMEEISDLVGLELKLELDPDFGI